MRQPVTAVGSKTQKGQERTEFFSCLNLIAGMNTIQNVLSGIASLALVMTLMPFVRSDYWTFRVFDFPRLQKLALSVGTFIAMACFVNGDPDLRDPVFTVLFVALGINCLYLIRTVIPYTPLYPKWVKKAKNAIPGNRISLVVSNVFQHNTDYDGCLNVVAEADPDLLLLLETDLRWKEHTAALGKTYPHQVLVPQENTYGMLLYSKLPLRNTEVRFLVEDDIPSIFCQVQLPGKKWVQLYCLHPTPPSPTENLRSTERDQELLITAEFARKSTLPVIVLGDLNDVAWSYTTELFLKMSGLLDPRIGRGFYNSFNAKVPLMRFPLDHVFVSSDFQHVKIRRLANFHSDHFPIYGQYQYCPQAEQEQEPLEATPEDVEVAAEKRNAT